MAVQELSKENIKDIYTLSPMQEGMFFHSLYDETSQAYFEQMSYRLYARLDVSIIKRSLQELFKRYDILRTVFIQKKANRILQVVLKEREVDFHYKDISGGTDQEEYLRQYKENDRQRLFNLGKDVLLRVAVIRTGEEEYEFIYSFHHIIMDGWCIGILTSEFLEIYNCTLEGKPHRLPRVKPYRDYIDWLEKQDREEAKNYWKKHLEDYDEQVTVPVFSAHKAANAGNPGYKIERVVLTVGVEDTARLAQLTGKAKVTMNTIVQAAWGIVLAWYNRKQDVLFGSVVSGRPSDIAGVESMVGLFINTVPVRIRFDETTTFKQLLQDVQASAVQSEPFHYYPLADIQNQSSLKQDLIDHIMEFQNFPVAEQISGAGENTTGRRELSVKIGQVDFFEQTHYNFNIRISPSERLEIFLEFNGFVHQESFVARMAGNLYHILQQVMKDENTVIRELLFLTSKEKEQILRQLNDTTAPYPKDRTIHEMFSEVAGKYPHHTAVVCEHTQVTYMELEERADRLAGILREKGLSPGRVAAIMTQRSIEMLIAMVAVLKTGAAYLPIDPAFPPERIQYMLKESQVGMLLTFRTDENQYPQIPFDGEIIDLNTRSVWRKNKLNAWNTNASSLSAYVIYTSGSTGKPKGVMIDHYSVINFNTGIVSRIDFSPGKIIPALTTISFDIFVLETLLPLLNGMKIIIVGEDRQKDPDLLARLIIKQRVDMLQVTPSTLKLLILNDEELGCLSRVRQLMVGGEAFPDHLFRSLKSKFNGSIYNMYGPTETTVWSAVRDLTHKINVDIGTPISNTRIYIVDSCYRLLPVGAAGELCIAGDGLARGYLNNPQLTAEKFIQTPQLPGERIYKTGDLARRLPDGNIEFLGRIDYQVKLRGFRIELGEIETLLVNRADIKEAVAVIRKDSGGDSYICAYFVPKPGITLTDTQLRDYLSAKLPYYMLPSVFVMLEKIPLTPNGKTDRKALPAPNITADETYTAPRDEGEEKMVHIWADVLGIPAEKIGINANFFQLGGHSLKATYAVSLIHKTFNVKIPLRQFFKIPTPAQLVKWMQQADLERYFSIEPAPESENYALSSAQKRLFFLHQMDETAVVYNMPLVLELHGHIHPDKLEHIFSQLIQRHESLRTSFQVVDGAPVQKIHPAVDFTIQYLNSGHGGQVETIVRDFVRPFDLSHVPLFRAGLIQIDEEKHILLTDMHHIISDGVSLQLLIRDFIRFYAGHQLPGMRLQYKDFSHWQNDHKHKDLLEQQRLYWVREFAGDIPLLDLPVDFPRPQIQSFEGARVDFLLTGPETRILKALALKEGTTLYMLMLTIYNIFLSRISGLEDIVIGTPVAGRRHADLEQVIGIFVNTLALRNRPQGEKIFNAFLREVNQRTLEAFENQEYPYEDLLEQVAVNRDAGRNPLFDTVFVMHNVEVTGADAHIEGLTVKQRQFQNETAKFDLTLSVAESGEKLLFTFEYCTKLFRTSTIQRFISYFKEIVASVSANPLIPMKEIEILPENEKQRLLSYFNNSYAQYPQAKTIHGLFSEQVQRSADRTAVVYEDLAVTYRELDLDANRLAHVLRKEGLQPGEPVGLILHRSQEIILCMLGILKAGGVYVPIDPDYPESRKTFTLKDSQVRIIIIDKPSMTTPLPVAHGCVLTLEHVRHSISACSDQAPPDVNDPADPAYIIYTSGSTGKPKGVIVEHRNVVRLFFHQDCRFDFIPADTWTMFHSPCFDFSVWEMYGALLFGGKLIIVPRMIARQPAQYLELLKSRAVSILNQTPTAFYGLAAEELQHKDNHLCLRYVIFGGEALHPVKLKDWKGKYPKARLINMFGITETTVHVTYKELTDDDISRDVRFIGTPIPTLSTYVMDRHMKLQPAGIVGELCVGGLGVSRGYLNRVEFTAERFIENPYQPGEKLYRSGDLVKVKDNDMEYLGRIDHQVQLRGFRVELGEIENQLLLHAKVKEALVIDGEDDAGDKFLCAYIVPGGDLESGELREYLSGKLPDYMVPSYFIPMDALPLTSNGKVDRKALPQPGTGRTGEHVTEARDDVEKQLARIWADVLGIDAQLIGIDDNFFDLGGHSLKAGAMTARIHREMNVKLPLAEVFITSDIRGLARLIRTAEKDKYFSINPAPKKDYYVLFSAQRRLYIMQQMESDSIAYNIPSITLIEGMLDRERLESAFRKLVKRHESLRTSFQTLNEEPVQVIHEHVDFAVEYYESQSVKAQGIFTPPDLIIKNFIRPFDLSKAPMMRVGVIHFEEKKHLLMVDIHHIITDGVSNDVLIRDFSLLYENKDLPALRLHYKDFSEWRNSTPVKEVVARQKEYWLKQFAGHVPQLTLATDFERPETKTFDGDSVFFIIEKDLNNRVLELVKETQATLFMVLLAVYNILLSHFTTQKTIVVGTPVTGRRHVDLQDVIGMFVNMLALKNYPDENKTFAEFLAEVKQNVLDAYENQDYQFETLITDLGLQGTTNRNPLFDVVFAMQKVDVRRVDGNEYEGIEHLKMKPYEFKRSVTPFDLLMTAFETEDRINMALEYSTRLFTRSTIEKMTAHYIEILEQILENRDVKLNDIKVSCRLVEMQTDSLLKDEGDFGF